MGKNKNLEQGRDAMIGLLDDSLLQMKEKFADTTEIAEGAFGKVGKRLEASESQSFLDLISGSDQAIDTIFSGMEKVSGTLGDSYRRKLDILNKGKAQSRSDIQTGTQGAMATSQERSRQALTQLQPYSQSGRSALSQYEDALQNPSLASNSPMAKYRKEQLESNLARQLNARGIGQGGSPITEYYSPGYNQIEAEESENYFKRLDPLMKYGYGADHLGAQLIDKQGGLEAKLKESEGKNLSGIEDAYAGKLTDVENTYSDSLSKYQDNAYTNQANLEKRLGEQKVDLRNIYDDKFSNNELGLADALKNLNMAEATGETNLNILKANAEQNYYQNKETLLDQINNVVETFNKVKEPAAQMAGAILPKLGGK